MLDDKLMKSKNKNVIHALQWLVLKQFMVDKAYCSWGTMTGNIWFPFPMYTTH